MRKTAMILFAILIALQAGNTFSVQNLRSAVYCMWHRLSKINLPNAHKKCCHFFKVSTIQLFFLFLSFPPSLSLALSLPLLSLSVTHFRFTLTSQSEIPTILHLIFRHKYICSKHADWIPQFILNQHFFDRVHHINF